MRHSKILQKTQILIPPNMKIEERIHTKRNTINICTYLSIFLTWAYMNIPFFSSYFLSPPQDGLITLE